MVPDGHTGMSTAEHFECQRRQQTTCKKLYLSAAHGALNLLRESNGIVHLANLFESNLVSSHHQTNRIGMFKDWQALNSPRAA